MAFYRFNSFPFVVWALRYTLADTVMLKPQMRTIESVKFQGSLTNNFYPANFEKSFYKEHQNISMITK